MPHQPSSLPEDARMYSHPDHIFRRGPISYSACQKTPEDTHILDTFSDDLSAIQLARRCQSTLTNWTHFQNHFQEPYQLSSLPEYARTCSQTGHIFRKQSSLPEHARTHSLSGHIFRKSLICYSACQKMEETLTLWTHFQEPHQPCSLPVYQNTLTYWTHFQKELISHSACQNRPEHAHKLDTFSEGTSSVIQLARRCQNTLTPWTFSKGASSAIQFAKRCQNALTL